MEAIFTMHEALALAWPCEDVNVAKHVLGWIVVRCKETRILVLFNKANMLHRPAAQHAAAAADLGGRAHAGAAMAVVRLTADTHEALNLGQRMVAAVATEQFAVERQAAAARQAADGHV